MIRAACSLLLAGVLFIVGWSEVSVADELCANLLVENSSALFHVFEACGAAVLASGGVNPPLSALAKLVLDTPDVTEETTDDKIFSEGSHFFTSSVNDLFQQPRANYPPFAAIGMLVADSVDCEVCIDTREVPCASKNFRFLELERGDAFLVDPVRTRYRLCDATQGHAGCNLATSSISKFTRFLSRRLFEPDYAFSTKPMASNNMFLVGKTDDQSRLFELARQLQQSSS